MSTQSPVSPATHHNPGSVAAASTAPAPLGRTLVLTGVGLALSIALTGSITGPKTVRFEAHLFAAKETVTAPTDGTIEELRVKPGQLVTTNQELLVLSQPKLKPQLDVAERLVQRLEAELCSAKAKATLDSNKLIEDLDRQIFQVEDQIAVLGGDCYLERMRVKAWSEQSSYFNALSSTEIPSGLQPITRQLQNPRIQMESILEEAQSENRAETLKARIELCQNRLKNIRDRKEQVLKQCESATGVPHIEHDLAAAKARHDELKAASDNQVLLASSYGLTGNITRNISDEVKAGDVLVEVFDRDREFLEAHIPARFASTLKPGDTVQIYFPNDTEREGQIESIPPETSKTNKDASEISIRVLPIGKVWPYLPIGSSVQVSVK